jgi:hypothetical protein
MHQFKTVSAILAIAFAAVPLAANAAGAGYSVQTPQSYYGAGSGNAGVPQGANIYAPVGVGNMVSNPSMSFAISGGNAVNLSGVGSGNINVQTNIDNTKTIDSSSNISVNETINGSNVAYGLDGANTLNVIDNAMSSDANVEANVKMNADAAVEAGLLAAELSN